MMKQRINPSNPKKSIEQSKIFRRRMSAFNIGIAILLSVQLLVTQFSILMYVSEALITIINFLFLAIILIWVLIFSFKTGQGGSQIKLDSEEKTTFIMHDEDSYWKFGIIYFNPDDPSLFVEKRFGIGVTVNFAKPLAWIFIIGIFVIVGVIIVFSS